MDEDPAERSEKAKEAKSDESSRRSRDMEEEDAAPPAPRGPAPESEPAADKSSEDDILEIDAKLDTRADSSPAKKQPAPKAPKASSKPGPWNGDDLGSGGIAVDEPYDGYGSGYGRRRPPPPRWKIGPASAPSYDALAKLEAMRQTVLRDPTRKSSRTS